MDLERRTDTAFRTINAPADAIYAAFVDPGLLLQWLPPAGMSGRIDHFEPRAGGAFRIALTYDDPASAGRGKTTADTDVVEGRFVELAPGERVVQAVTFRSDDPQFAGEMTATWSFRSEVGGTKVTVVCTGVPPGVRKEDHDVGLRSSLENLARLVER